MSLVHPVRRARSAEPLPLRHLVDLARAVLDDHPGNALLRVAGRPPDIEARGLADRHHPLDLLLGFRAPAHWEAIGLHCPGRAYDVPEPHHTGPPPASSPVAITVLIDRSGAGVGVVDGGPGLRRLTGLPDGVLGDTLRRTLDLPTAPPPATTVGLWLHVWLDRVVDLAESRAGAGPLSWDEAAQRHPTCHGMPTVPLPDEVVEATHRMAESWPWWRLRSDPEVVDTGRPPLQHEIALWMDDGMYARWVLGQLTAPAVLFAAAQRLLAPHALRSLAESVDRCCRSLLPVGAIEGLR